MFTHKKRICFEQARLYFSAKFRSAIRKQSYIFWGVIPETKILTFLYVAIISNYEWIQDLQRKRWLDSIINSMDMSIISSIMVCLYVCLCVCMYNSTGFPGCSVVNNLPANAGDTGLVPGSGRSPGGGKWQPTPVVLLGKSHGQRRLLGYIHGVAKEWDKTQQVNRNNNV